MTTAKIPAKIMRYKKLLTTSIIAITLAMMFTATIPFQQQQEAYASHQDFCDALDPGRIAVHIGGAPAGCIPPRDFEQQCELGFPYDECPPPPPPPDDDDDDDNNDDDDDDDDNNDD
jgi:hypothetical protein